MWMQALQDFTPDQQKAFLRFVTACSRPPLLGFKYLDPALCIQVRAAASAPVRLTDCQISTTARQPSQPGCNSYASAYPGTM